MTLSGKEMVFLVGLSCLYTRMNIPGTVLHTSQFYYFGGIRKLAPSFQIILQYIERYCIIYK